MINKFKVKSFTKRPIYLEVVRLNLISIIDIIQYKFFKVFPCYQL